ncbi:ZNF136 isoform 3, partial [Pan troglodytes]
MLERLYQTKDGSQRGGIFSQFANQNLSKKIPGVKLCESIVYGEVSMGQSSLNRHIKDHSGHEPKEYQEYGEKPDTRNQCWKPFSSHHSF